MTRFDTQLTDPDAKAVHAAIEDAFRAVRQKTPSSSIPHTKISVKRIAERAASEPEGVEFWASRTSLVTGNTGQVSVAWWTAVSGRRHVRVMGRIVTPETDYLVNSSKMNTRPAVWHVFPDRVYRRRAGKANDLVVVCGCGAVGTERSLGWAGACCGPCFDYLEENGKLPHQRPALLPTPTPCLAVGGSADGRWVAAASSGQVVLWDLEQGAEPVQVFGEKADTTRAPPMMMDFGSASVPTDTEGRLHVAFSPGGEYLAIVAAAFNGLRLIDLRNSKYPVVTQTRGVGTAAFRPMVETPRTKPAPTLFDELPDVLPPAREALYFTLGGSVMVASPPTAHSREFAIPAVAHGGPIVFSQTGTRFALRAGHQVRVHETDGKTLATIPFPDTTLYRSGPISTRVSRSRGAQYAFSPDGGQIAVGYDQAFAVYHAVTGERRFHNGQLPDVVTGVLFDPGGKWLYVGRGDGTLVAYRGDVPSEDRSVVFRWSLGPIHALAPFGDSLLAACDEGVQIWPMAKLLEGM